MRILLTGLGSIGQRHLANLRTMGFTDLLVFRVRGRPVPAVEAAGIPVYTDLQAALAQGPDVVFVTNPTSLHLPTALVAAKAGCHLFIEKPLSHTLEGVADLKAVVDGKRLTAMVGCQLRFHPHLRRVRELLRDGAIGTVVSARLYAGEYLPDWHPDEDYRHGYSARRDLGGGVILTLIHELDYAYWLFGEVASVQAASGTRSGLELDVEDTAEVLLETVEGATLSIHLDYIQRPPTRTLSVVGETGTVEWDYYGHTLRWYDAKARRWHDEARGEAVERNTLFLDEVKHFFSCITHGTEPLIPIGEAERVLEIAVTAKQAAGAGKTIRLPAATQAQHT